MTDPILSAPPAFVLLAIILTLSAYLRQLSEHRRQQNDDIEDGTASTRFPLGEQHTAAQLKRLSESQQNLNIVAHLLIFFSIVISVRLLMLAYARWRCPSDSQYLATGFRIFDMCIMSVLLVLFIGLWVMHFLSRRSEKRIRRMTEEWRVRRKQEQPEPPSSMMQ